MTAPDDISVHVPERNRFEVALDVALIGLSVAMMLLGLLHWAVIIGITEGASGGFLDMSQPRMIATMYLAVVDLVAAVGLWMRVSWGRVVWVLAAVTETAFHTAFVSVFGGNLLIVIFHTATLLAVGALFVLAQRGGAGRT